MYNVDGVTRWKAACLSTASSLLDDGKLEPMSTWQLDQILAASREAGITEREQGVFLLAMILSEVDRRPWAQTMPSGKRVAVATAFTMQVLQTIR